MPHDFLLHRRYCKRRPYVAHRDRDTQFLCGVAKMRADVKGFEVADEQQTRLQRAHESTVTLLKASAMPSAARRIEYASARWKHAARVSGRPQYVNARSSALL